MQGRASGMIPFPLSGAPQRLPQRGGSQLQDSTAREEERHKILTQVSDSLAQSLFTTSAPFSSSPHLGRPGEISGGQEARFQPSAPSASRTAVLRSCWGLWGLRRI